MVKKLSTMLFLSELYGRIGQILQEHGDMPVARLQDLHIDGILTNRGSGFMGFDNTNFFIHQSTLVDNNGFGKAVASRKRFVINPYGNEERDESRY